MRKSLLALAALAFTLVVVLPAAADGGAAGCLAQELGLAEMSVSTGVETLDEIGTPQPIAMACSDEWYEYRWTYGGCCYNPYANLREKEQRRHCCLQGPPNGGVTCGSWQDTGAARCTGKPCPV